MLSDIRDNNDKSVLFHSNSIAFLNCAVVFALCCSTRGAKLANKFSAILSSGEREGIFTTFVQPVC